MTAVAALCAALAVALAIRSPGIRSVAEPRSADPPFGWPAIAGVGLALLGCTAALGSTGLLVALGLLTAGWIGVRTGGGDPAGREAAADLPHLVGLLGDALRAGQPTGNALEQVTAALPGPAADRLVPVAARLRIGMDPVSVWSVLSEDPALAPLGRTMARAQATGASVISAVDGLAENLADLARQDAETKARAIGVKAAVPLGLCLLPSFVLLGVVPVVAILVTDLTR
jgi:Flp pilus assembly protein TadB